MIVMEKYKSASYGDDAAHSVWYKKDCCSWKRGVQVCYNCGDTSTFCFVLVLSSDFFNYQHHKNSLNHLTLSCTTELRTWYTKRQLIEFLCKERKNF